MDQTMLDVLEKALAARGYVALNWDDPSVQNAAIALTARGWLSMDMAGRVCLTPAGLNALLEYHEGEKEASREKTCKDAEAKRKARHDFAVAIIGAAAGSLFTLLVQWIWKLVFGQ